MEHFPLLLHASHDGIRLKPFDGVERGLSLMGSAKICMMEVSRLMSFQFQENYMNNWQGFERL